MNDHKDSLWSAYIDGELSAADSARFDQALTAAERDRLEREIRLEGALGEVLSRDARCPDLVWAQAKASILKNAAPQKRSNVFTQPLSWKGVLATAAILAITAAAYFYQTTRTGAEFLRLSEEERTLPGLSQTSEIPANDVPGVNEFMHSHGFDVDLKPDTKGFDQPRHRRRLLGAREASYDGEPVMELLFDCCGMPIKVVLMRDDSAAASMVNGRFYAQQVEASRHVGGYVAAVVGRHHAEGLLQFLVEQNESKSTHA